AAPTTWHVLHEMIPERDSLGSKKSLCPRSIRSGVPGLSGGCSAVSGSGWKSGDTSAGRVSATRSSGAGAPLAQPTAAISTREAPGRPRLRPPACPAAAERGQRRVGLAFRDTVVISPLANAVRDPFLRNTVSPPAR